MSDDGELKRVAMVQFERILPGPIERVWEYLTDTGKLPGWFGEGTIEPRLGGAEIVIDLVQRNRRRDCLKGLHRALKFAVAITADPQKELRLEVVLVGAADACQPVRRHRDWQGAAGNEAEEARTCDAHGGRRYQTIEQRKRFARIRAALRRLPQVSNELQVLRFDDVEINFNFTAWPKSIFAIFSRR